MKNKLVIALAGIYCFFSSCVYYRITDYDAPSPEFTRLINQQHNQSGEKINFQGGYSYKEVLTHDDSVRMKEFQALGYPYQAGNAYLYDPYFFFANNRVLNANYNLRDSAAFVETAKRTNTSKHIVGSNWGGV